jgi:hypothetical protein
LKPKFDTLISDLFPSIIPFTIMPKAVDLLDEMKKDMEEEENNDYKV